jgi:hypothetical protein
MKRPARLGGTTKQVVWHTHAMAWSATRPLASARPPHGDTIEHRQCQRGRVQTPAGSGTVEYGRWRPGGVKSGEGRNTGDTHRSSIQARVCGGVLTCAPQVVTFSSTGGGLDSSPPSRIGNHSAMTRTTSVTSIRFRARDVIRTARADSRLAHARGRRRHRRARSRLVAKEVRWTARGQPSAALLRQRP